MVTNDPSGSIASALFGKTRRAVLTLLFSDGERSYHLRQIVRETRAGQGAVQRELTRLVQAGLLVRSRQANLVLYQANRASPVFAELRGLMLKTAGLADVLREALSSLSNRIMAAFIYGSIAQGSDKPASDVDVMVIGEATFGEVGAALRAAEETLSREINPSVYPLTEVRDRLAAKDHFITTVIKGPKIFLIGGEHELEKLAG